VWSPWPPRCGRFKRHVLIDNLDQDKVAATFNEGVLTVTLPSQRGQAEREKARYQWQSKRQQES